MNTMSPPGEPRTTTAHFDPDFSRQVLDDLYRYRLKHPLIAWLLWATLGLVGAHRIYLGRELSAVLMLFTGGGFFVWWVADALYIQKYIDEHNAEQARRREAGLPPLELAFMPPRTQDVLHEPPAWTQRWQARGSFRRRFRLAGDATVLGVAGFALGALSGLDGAEEAIFAILVILGLTALGGTTAGLQRIPILRGLLVWNHRLRLFYYANEPRSPLGLLLRPLTGPLRAPFNARDRTEVRLYIRLGILFVLAFFLLDLFEHVMAPLARGEEPLGVLALARVLMQEAIVTFVVICAFGAPIGAVLTVQLLTRRTHTVPRVLSALTLVVIILGAMA